MNLDQIMNHVDGDYRDLEAWKPTITEWKVGFLVALASEIIFGLMDFAVAGTGSVLSVLPFQLGEVIGLAISYGVILIGARIISEKSFSLNRALRFGVAVAAASFILGLPEMLMSLATTRGLVRVVLSNLTYPFVELTEVAGLYVLYNRLEIKEIRFAAITAVLGYLIYTLVFWMARSQEFFISNIFDSAVYHLSFIFVATAASLIKIHEITDLEKYKFTGIFLISIGGVRYLSFIFIPSALNGLSNLGFVLGSSLLTTVYTGLIVYAYSYIYKGRKTEESATRGTGEAG